MGSRVLESLYVTQLSTCNHSLKMHVVCVCSCVRCCDSNIHIHETVQITIRKKKTVIILRLLSWRMMADSVLLVTHSSSLPIPSGTAVWHRWRGSMFLFTKGMMAFYISQPDLLGDREQLWGLSGNINLQSKTVSISVQLYSNK